MRGATRSILSISAVLAAGVIAGVPIGTAANADTIGVDLTTRLASGLYADDGDTSNIRFDIADGGTVPVPGGATFHLEYGLPVQPAQEPGGYDDMKFLRGPVGASCNVNPTARVVDCTLPAIAAGQTVSLYFTAVADIHGATAGWSGAMYSEVRTSATDSNPANNIQQGGISIAPRPTPTSPPAAPAGGISTDGTTATSPMRLDSNLWLHSPNGQYIAGMQADGNFVVSGNGRPLWSTGTSGHQAAQLALQGDGNAVVLDTAGRALWSTRSAGRGTGVAARLTDDGALTFTVGGQTVLSERDGADTAVPTVTLTGGQYLSDASGTMQLRMQADGNLVLYRGSTAVWSTGTSRFPGGTVVVQSDGNVVLRSASGAAVWSTGTSRAGGAGVRLVVQADGNTVLYKNSTALWSTGTRR